MVIIIQKCLEVSKSYKFKAKETGSTSAAGNNNNVEIALQLKYLINFVATSEMSRIKCKIKQGLTWSANWVFSAAAEETTFVLTNTKLFVPIAILSIQHNSKLLQQLT